MIFLYFIPKSCFSSEVYNWEQTSASMAERVESLEYSPQTPPHRFESCHGHSFHNRNVPPSKPIFPILLSLCLACSVHYSTGLEVLKNLNFMDSLPTHNPHVCHLTKSIRLLPVSISIHSVLIRILPVLPDS